VGTLYLLVETMAFVSENLKQNLTYIFIWKVYAELKETQPINIYAME